eukprot:785872-Pleurochrysis_carterae.AAC.1
MGDVVTVNVFLGAALPAGAGPDFAVVAAAATLAAANATNSDILDVVDAFQITAPSVPKLKVKRGRTRLQKRL